MESFIIHNNNLQVFDVVVSYSLAKKQQQKQIFAKDI
jgi:hypothetical protein